MRLIGDLKRVTMEEAEVDGSSWRTRAETPFDSGALLQLSLERDPRAVLFIYNISDSGL